MLKTRVKAGNINNLTDARYFAGMGVQILGFPADENVENRPDTSRIKEIMGWVAGVSFAIEFGTFDKGNVQQIIDELNPDYIQIPIKLSESCREISDRPLILVASREDMDLVNRFYKSGDFILLKDKEKDLSGDLNWLQRLAKEYPVLIGYGLAVENIHAVLEKVNPAGIALEGGNEIRPGLRSFDELADILEILETE